MTIEQCCETCTECGADWSIVLEQYDVEEYEHTFDTSVTRNFCSLDCFRQWIDENPAVVYGSEQNH